MVAQVAVLGGSGLVGSRVLDLWADAYDAIAPSHAQVDVLDTHSLESFVAQTPAETVVNFAAWADVDGAEPQQGDTTGTVYCLNVDYPRRLAELCKRQHKYLLHVSTDYVFDGTSADRAYLEGDTPRPLCWYAETKLGGEQAIVDSGADACIARIEMPFMAGQHAKRDLARIVMARLQAGQTIQGVADQRVTPVFLDDAAAALRKLLDARYTGIVHIASSDWTTPYAFARGIARRLGLREDLIVSETFERFSTTRPARRPQHSWLNVSRFASLFGLGILRPVEDELDSWADQIHHNVSSSRQ